MCKPLGIIASCVAFSCAATFASALDITSPDKQELLPLALRGVHFVPNHGQWVDARVYFGLRSRGLDVAFSESAFTMHLARQAGSESRGRIDQLTPSLDPMLLHGGDSPADRADFEHLTLTVSFPGSNSVVPEGGEPQAAKFNYFVGGEGRGMASDVPSFGAIVYHNLYDGVDLHVMGSDDGVLKYEFHVAPGADYGLIRISYDGIESLCIDESGDLRIATAFGKLTDRAPLVWQDVDGERIDASARFEVCNERTYRIVVGGEIDASRALVIDPDVEWMYYLGGSHDDRGEDVEIDGANNILVTGMTRSVDFDGRANSFHGEPWDAFILKSDRTGVVQWMTYLGGASSDAGRSLAVNAAGDIFVAGETSSTDFEGRNNSYHGSQDAFALKVDPAGQLLWMTYLGGSGNDLAMGMALIAGSDILVTGETSSIDVEGRSNAFHGGISDAFVGNVRSSGSLGWMTYLGGSGDEGAIAIIHESTAEAFVTGYTDSADFEGRNNFHHGGISTDAFVAKIGALGALQWMTYLGGTSEDIAIGIALGDGGQTFITGHTQSIDFEGGNNANHGGSPPTDSFVAKIGATGMLEWMTYLGGTDEDVGLGITLRDTDHLLVAGRTGSIDFEGRSNAFFGGADVFVADVATTGVLHWMMFLGGSDWENCGDIALGGFGSAFIVGETSSIDFDGRVNSTHGAADCFLFKLRLADAPQLSVAATCPSGGPIQVSWSGATGGGTIVLLYARNTGLFRIPNGNPCAGTQTGLGSNQIEIAYQGSAGPSGSRTLNANSGAGACGGYLQLLDLATCATSNVARIQ